MSTKYCRLCRETRDYRSDSDSTGSLAQRGGRLWGRAQSHPRPPMLPLRRRRILQRANPSLAVSEALPRVSAGASEPSPTNLAPAESRPGARVRPPIPRARARLWALVPGNPQGRLSCPRPEVATGQSGIFQGLEVRSSRAMGRIYGQGPSEAPEECSMTTTHGPGTNRVPVTQLCEHCGEVIHGMAKRKCGGRMLELKWRSHRCRAQHRRALGKRSGKSCGIYPLARLLGTA